MLRLLGRGPGDKRTFTVDAEYIIDHIDDIIHDANSGPEHSAGMPGWLPHYGHVLDPRQQNWSELRALGR